MNEHDRNLERLSAYIDDALSPEEKRALEASLAQDEALRAELDDMRETVQMLRNLPPVKAPRNFTLDPKTYGSTSGFAWWGLRLAYMLGSVAVLALALGAILLLNNTNLQSAFPEPGPPPIAAQPSPQANQAQIIGMTETGERTDESEILPTPTERAIGTAETQPPSDTLLDQEAPAPPEMQASGDTTISPLEEYGIADETAPPGMGGGGDFAEETILGEAPSTTGEVSEAEPDALEMDEEMMAPTAGDKPAPETPLPSAAAAAIEPTATETPARRISPTITSLPDQETPPPAPELRIEAGTALMLLGTMMLVLAVGLWVAVWWQRHR